MFCVSSGWSFSRTELIEHESRINSQDPLQDCALDEMINRYGLTVVNEMTVNHLLNHLFILNIFGQQLFGQYPCLAGCVVLVLSTIQRQLALHLPMPFYLKIRTTKLFSICRISKTNGNRNGNGNQRPSLTPAKQQPNSDRIVLLSRQNTANSQQHSSLRSQEAGIIIILYLLPIPLHL